MSKRNLSNLTNGQRKQLQKNQKQGLKLPVAVYKTITEDLLTKYGIKSFQALYDYLIVSGLTYLKKDIVDLARSRIPEYTERYKRHNLAKLGKGPPEPAVEMKTLTVFMYDRDYEAFNKFVIEEKTAKKFWLVQILMEEFVAENPIIINHIKDCQKHKVTERKQQVSRLINDEYILILGEREADELLERMTERYDNRQFDSTIITAEIDKIAKAAKKKHYEEVEAEEDFNEKLKSIRFKRTQKVQALIEPISDDD